MSAFWYGTGYERSHCLPSVIEEIRGRRKDKEEEDLPLTAKKILEIVGIEVESARRR
jgi:hypothetical protein